MTSNDDTSVRVNRRRFVEAVGFAGVVGLAGCGGDGGGTGGDGGDGSGGDSDGGGVTPEDGGDGGETTETETEGDGGSGQTTTLTVARGSEGTATSQLAVGWAEVVKANTNIRLSLQASGGTIASTRLVSNGEVDMGHAQSITLEDAYRANDPFENQIRNVTLLFNDFVSTAPVAYTLEGNDIDYLEDLIGTTMAGGPPGSGPQPNLINYLKANDLWEGEGTINFQKVSYPEGAQLVGSGRVDACVGYTLTHQLASWTDEFITRNDDAKIVLPKSEQRIQNFADATPGVTAFQLRGDNLRHAWENSVASGMDTYLTVGQPGAWMCSEDINEEHAYQVTKAAIENRQNLPQFTNLWTDFANDPVGIGLVYKSENVKYHPAVVRAYEDVGMDPGDIPVANI